MARKSKRHDPADAPIDGDYAFDVVHGKDPGFDYVLTDPEDVPRIRMRGGVRVDREGATESLAWDMGDASDPDFKVGNLVLMKIEKERNKRYHDQAQRINDQRLTTHKKAARKSGGEYSVQRAKA